MIGINVISVAVRYAVVHGHVAAFIGPLEDDELGLLEGDTALEYSRRKDVMTLCTAPIGPMNDNPELLLTFRMMADSMARAMLSQMFGGMVVMK